MQKTLGENPLLFMKKSTWSPLSKWFFAFSIVLDEIQELETYLNDRIDPPEYLIGKYKRRKEQALNTFSVGILEDVPQFIFNIIKAESTVITMVSISLSAVSFGYKLSMP